MGKKGGVSSFSTKEYEMLKKIYNKRSDLNEKMLTEAFLRASSKTVPNIVYEIQIFKNRKESE